MPPNRFSQFLPQFISWTNIHTKLKDIANVATVTDAVGSSL